MPQHDVFRLDVAVNDSGLVRAGERARNLDGHVERLMQFELISRQTPPQRLAFDIFGADEVSPVYLPDLEDGDDVRMVETGRGARLALETTRAVRVLRELRRQQFERDLTPEPR